MRGSQSAPAGRRPGWDFAGTVERAAADGSGPKEGARVVGMLSSGAWGELIAAPTRALAVLPDSVTFAVASTLPVAGLTALYALRRGGLLLGKKVLVTGASGGVGHLAVRLARHAGAHVVGAVRTAERETLVRDAGAHEVAVGEDLAAAKGWGPYDLILESVGGKTLTDALAQIAPDGACVLFGTSAGSEVTFDAARFFLTGGANLYGFILFHEVERTPPGEGLAELTALVADGRLRPAHQRRSVAGRRSAQPRSA